MNKPTKTSLIPNQSFLILQDYDLIDHEILKFEKQLEEMKAQGYVYCSICCVEINIDNQSCKRCSDYLIEHKEESKSHRLSICL